MDFKTKRMNDFKVTLNDLTFSNYYHRLEMLALSIFKWNNLPNGVSERWIERYLFDYGECMFFHDETLGYMVTKCADHGVLNHYDEPTHLTPVATNYTNTKPYKIGEECVHIKNNAISYPTKDTIELFAYRLADITRTIDINIHAQKTPTLMKGSDKKLLSLKNVYRQWDGNAPVIFVDDSFDDSFSVYKTDAPIVFPQLQVQKHALWNEAMTSIGINNANQEKRERLVASEVDANNEQVAYIAETMLKTRQEACDMMNKLFGFNVSVEIENPQNLQNLVSEEVIKEPEEEGEQYD